MLILRHWTHTAPAARGAVVAIGNFDGIHRGHQALIAKAGRLAREMDAPLALMSFEPHPRLFFQPDQPPFRLTNWRTKAKLIESLGVDLLYVLAFNAELAGLEAEDFVAQVLVGGPEDGLAARHVVVGDNFRFGRKRRGDAALLAAEGRRHGFGVTAMAPVSGPGDSKGGEKPYSSSLVREYLKGGNPTRAALLLGRYWEIEGRVESGARRGRTLGFPTANLRLGELLRPAYGVYAVRAAIEHEEGERGAGATVWRPGVANLGINPMFELPEPLLETHLFDFEGDLYGRHLRVALIDYLRPEARFESVEKLVEQMAADSARARATLSWETWQTEWPVSPFIAGGG
ncbi:FMN adenylyltransferase /riboflavin kinase [Tistlia consotensis]|uniref:Riboflavin biosynthesis protein n=1 Tax=Tistlia consotensis USBA 355 TaxID=560819 RepID=A0A1Y6CP02_9PROT|nr:bifunctional riboflavin kinase/FAD synthetase [Tistlia consotensis]SMF80845.1 FMN adenylyltransferase /riboflavin kinase [Tistlia consotensis USBA 355]SNS21852.1 FMN adenylyltransferase /riboflavin kinase [Tistlia consotensis]